MAYPGEDNFPRRPQRQTPMLRVSRGNGVGGFVYTSEEGHVATFAMDDASDAMQFGMRNTALRPAGNGALDNGQIGQALRGPVSPATTDFWRQHQVGATAPATLSAGFQQGFPLSWEVVVEPLGFPVTTYASIAHNAGETNVYNGMNLQWRPTGELRIFVGDGTGNTASDFKSWEGTAQLTAGKIYHIIASAGGVGSADAEIFINGIKDPIATEAGTGAAIGYSGTVDIGFAVAGGNIQSAEAFNGRLYLVRFFNRRIFEAEAGVRYRRIWREMRDVNSLNAQVFAADPRPLLDRLPWRPV